jgi:hypothetical protein
MGVGGERHAPAALPPGKKPGIHDTGGWVGLRASLDGYEKSRPHLDSMPGANRYTDYDIPAKHTHTRAAWNGLMSKLDAVVGCSDKVYWTRGPKV